MRLAMPKTLVFGADGSYSLGGCSRSQLAGYLVVPAADEAAAM